MGGKSSKGTTSRQLSSSSRSNSSQRSHHEYPQSPQAQQSESYAFQHNYPLPQDHAYPPQDYVHPVAYPPPDYVHPVARPQEKLERRFSRIADNFNSLAQELCDLRKFLIDVNTFFKDVGGLWHWALFKVTEALAQAGLESSNLIVGIDFTKSNEWTGARSFNQRSLHCIGDVQNPYEQAISIIGRTLSAFDEDSLIPCFGFGDSSTYDQDVFSFYPDDRPCNGFEEALARYREIVPHLKLSGPTSFAPIIEMAMTIVEKSGGQYHVLLIIADGQVTRSSSSVEGQLSPQEQKTVEAIVKSSEYPLSIILVGVGDGPWDMMKEFDDYIPTRSFDNFQFANFTEIMLKNVPVSRKETEFALTALMEIPSQYIATMELKLLGCRRGKSPDRVPLPPPLYGVASFTSKPSHTTSFEQITHPYHGHGTYMATAPPESSAFDSKPFEKDIKIHGKSFDLGGGR